MYFHYVASQADGKMSEGNIEAPGPSQALGILGSKGLRPISLSVIKEMERINQGGIFGQRITLKEKVFLTKYLALMLKVGTDLFKAIDILVADFDRGAMKALLVEIRSNLEKGKPFYSTFEKYPRYFNAVFVNLIKVGEISGNLEAIFWELSITLQKDQDLRQRIKSAFIYPLILLVGSFLMLTFLVSFALPKIAAVFMNSGIKPPTFSIVVFSVGNFFGSYLVIIYAVLAIAGFGGWYFFSRTLSGKQIMQRALTKTPVVNDLLKKIALQRFASTLGLLLKSGMPILDSLNITADAVGYEEIRGSLLRISGEGITKGLTVGEAFRREEAFPRVIVNLMSISEKAGHLEEVLFTLANFYESEIDASVKIFISFLEPALLLGIGLIIGTIALAIIVPVYQLVGNF
ncbi:MAG: type II secretion system F family protein [Candidatus Wolfebacteria bacterium]|nr:type II secretion system F family protein [Candidatus Wolfebacteria bacterium]